MRRQRGRDKHFARPVRRKDCVEYLRRAMAKSMFSGSTCSLAAKKRLRRRVRGSGWRCTSLRAFRMGFRALRDGPRGLEQKRKVQNRALRSLFEVVGVHMYYWIVSVARCQAESLRLRRARAPQHQLSVCGCGELIRLWISMYRLNPSSSFLFQPSIFGSAWLSTVRSLTTSRGWR